MNKELKTGIRGLSIVCSDDGVWLSTKSDTGRSLMMNLSNIAKETGGIRGSALFEWCEQTAKEAAVYENDTDRSPIEAESLAALEMCLDFCQGQAGSYPHDCAIAARKALGR